MGLYRLLCVGTYGVVVFQCHSSSDFYHSFPSLGRTRSLPKSDKMSSTLTVAPTMAPSPPAPRSGSELPIPVSPKQPSVRRSPTTPSSSLCNLSSQMDLRLWKQRNHSSPPLRPPVSSTSQTSPPLFPRLSSHRSSNSQPASSLAPKHRRIA